MLKNLRMIGGTWDDNGGRPSGFIRKLYEAIAEKYGFFESTLSNGGYWEDLKIELGLVEEDDILLWFSDVPDDKVKLIGGFKDDNPRAILVTSKNNDGDKCDFLHIISLALKNKANLIFEFKRSSGIVYTSIYDPLGNCFCKDASDVAVVAEALVFRLMFLARMTRVESKKVGSETRSDGTQSQFIEIVKGYANTFHEAIHGLNPSRLMGNCSFRCSFGFPSFRQNDYIFVSRRNLDKRDLNESCFVAVEPITMYDFISKNINVRYYGDHKPSVDTPIQLALYALYPYINYMVHSHVYIDGAPMTERVIPCGALEEIDDIIEIGRSSMAKDIVINLRGHGSIAMSGKLEGINNLPYVARVVPECHD